MHKKVYNGDDYTYVEPTLMVVYNASGVITQVIVYTAELGSVSVDIDILQIQNPSRYNYLQEKVNEGLSARNYSVFD